MDRHPDVFRNDTGPRRNRNNSDLGIVTPGRYDLPPTLLTALFPQRSQDVVAFRFGGRPLPPFQSAEFPNCRRFALRREGRGADRRHFGVRVFGAAGPISANGVGGCAIELQFRLKKLVAREGGGAGRFGPVAAGRSPRRVPHDAGPLAPTCLSWRLDSRGINVG